VNILVVSHEYPPIGGGGANACMHLCSELTQMNNNITLVTTWFDGLEKDYYHNSLFHVIRLTSKRKHKEHCGFPEMLDYLMKAIKVTDKLCKKQHFDMCMVFFAIPSGPIGYLLKKKYNIPYIIRFGGGDIPGFQARFKILYKIIGPFEKILLKKADSLVANSMGLKKLANDFYDKRPIEIITNGADEVDAWKKTREKEAPVRLLFVSRLIERKGIQHIIPRLNEINKKIADGVHLTIVGDGPYREELERITDDSNTRSLVTFVGQKDKKDLPDYYNDADIFIFPSRKEGMPNVVLEAMSYGLPVVMTPCEGSIELIDGNGYIADIDNIPNRIIELCNDDNKLESMGQESLRRIKESFSWKQKAIEYMELMEKCYKNE